MYHQIMNKHPHRFQTGSVIKRRTFCKLFRIKGVIHSGPFDEIQRANLKLVGVQADVNNILRQSGLVMKSRDYYSEFYIANLKETGETVLAHQEKAEAHKRCSNDLEKAVISRLRAGTWGQLGTVVPSVTGSVTPRRSLAYKAKQRRVKRWK